MIDPVLLEILSSAPPGETVAPMSAGLEEVRRTRAAVNAASDELARRITEPGPEVAQARDVSIADGVRARYYRPAGEGPFGAHLYVHGGSFTQGSPDDVYVDATCRERCAGAGVVVLSLDYRLAPEHQFPAAVDDTFAALTWLRDHAAEFDVDPANLSVGGGSAGGNLAAAVMLMARDRSGPDLRLALLEVPALDLTGGHLDRTLGPMFGDVDAVAAIFAAYLGDPARAHDPLASPLLAADLSGLSPVHVMTAELDPLRGDGETFLQLLDDAGVKTSGGRRAGHLHVSPAFTAVFPPAREWRAEVIDVLRAHHRTDSK
jgi:acetyl esterase